MSDPTDESRTLFVDASVFITLAVIGSLEMLRETEGQISVPVTVVEEITSEPARSELEDAIDRWISTPSVVGYRTRSDEWNDCLETAATHLDRSRDPDDWGGDVPLLAAGLYHEQSVVVSDDKPLRKTCKMLSIPVSGSIGVLIRAVERGDLDAVTVKDELEAMDEAGARLSARLLRRAERLIDGAAGN